MGLRRGSGIRAENDPLYQYVEQLVMIDQTVLIIFGVICGLAYAFLGIAVTKHMSHPTYFDKYIGWSLWWFLERERYSEKGKKYCDIGMMLAVAGTASCILYFVN